jgi:CPA1 family monovalent cation:H+ antiporter
MEFMVLLIALLFGTVLMVGVGERLRLPYPVLMLLFSAAVALIPGLPEIHVQPDLILPLFLPPLLFAAAQRSSWSVFRVRWKSLILLAVLLVLVTAFAVAGVASWIIPSLTFTGALALGALSAPPDPVAVEAVAGKVNMPRRLLTLLQTEGLFNDAIAIVLFTLAVDATVEGNAVGWSLVPRFLLSAAVAVAIGFVMAWLVGWLNRFVPNMVARSAVTIVAPYAVYMLAEEVHASGVVAVVVTALEMGRRARPQDSQERLTRTSFWSVIELLITGAAFGLVGMEMRYVLEDEGSTIVRFIPGAIAVCAVVLVVRLGWFFLIYKVGGTESKRRTPGSLKDVLVLTWCGMRGLATLALALALPTHTADGDAFPGRNFIVTCAAAVLLVTLVIPGLTLPSLMRALKLPVHDAEEARLERLLARKAEMVAVETIRTSETAQKLPEKRRLALERRMSSLHTLLETDYQDDPDKMLHLKNVLGVMDAVQRQALQAARREVLKARKARDMDPEAVDRVLRRLDLRTVTLDR